MRIIFFKKKTNPDTFTPEIEVTFRLSIEELVDKFNTSELLGAELVKLLKQQSNLL
jgi:hypothetical protein